MLRFRPLGTAFATIATEVGRHNDTATPWIARNMINSIPVRARPHAKINAPVNKQPAKFTRRLPITSATEPARSRQVLIVKLVLVSRDGVLPKGLTGIRQMARVVNAQGETGQMLSLEVQ